MPGAPKMLLLLVACWLLVVLVPQASGFSVPRHAQLSCVGAKSACLGRSSVVSSGVVGVPRVLSSAIRANDNYVDIVPTLGAPDLDIVESEVEGGLWKGSRALTTAGKALLPTALALAGCMLAARPAMAATMPFLEQLSKQANDSGFLQSFLLIFISEIGDKTFFIAGLLAAKYGRVVSFTGSIGALGVMTVISTVLGQLFHAVPPSLTQGVPYDDVVAVLAFTYFGLKTLLDASKLEDGNNSGIDEERQEAEEIVEGLNDAQRRSSLLANLGQTFSLVFAAEIGDRSFLSTIALSAALNPFAVAGGAVVAHATATGIAVAGGVLLSRYLSEKVIGYIGGGLFLVFAATTAFGVF